jgi:hypothetical protein
MNIGWDIESLILVTGIIGSTIGCILILRYNWKQYGLLLLTSAITGELLCYFFVTCGFYSFPYRLFPNISPMPFFLVLTMFPCLVLLGVCYSPISWKYKIPFYWIIVHLGMLFEVLSQTYTKVINYGKYWDTWDSYTWWWLFLLIFELIGGILVSKEYRRPISEAIFRYGNLGWFILHFILIFTILLSGLYLGLKL